MENSQRLGPENLTDKIKTILFYLGELKEIPQDSQDVVKLASSLKLDPHLHILYTAYINKTKESRDDNLSIFFKRNCRDNLVYQVINDMTNKSLSTERIGALLCSKLESLYDAVTRMKEGCFTKEEIQEFKKMYSIH